MSTETGLLVTVVTHEKLQSLLSTGNTSILGVTVVDTRTGDFEQLTTQYIHRILSSDIKIYEASSSSRAYFAEDIEVLPDNWQGHEDAIAVLRSCLCTVLHGADAISNAASENDSIEFVRYTPTHVELGSNTASEAYLILADAYYSGWRATVNGEEVPIYRANVMFRAVRVPAGESTVIFEFVPMLWYYAMAFGAVVWVCMLLACSYLWWRRHG